MSEQSEDDILRCVVKGCDSPAIARVFPTHGETPHDALRCRDHLLRDLDREWFQEWRRAIQNPEQPDTEQSKQ